MGTPKRARGFSATGPLLSDQEAIVLAITCLAAGPVFAQSTESGLSNAMTTLESVSVTGRRADGYGVKDSASATKLSLTPRETPQSLTVITRERMEDQNLDSLRAVLDNTPGVYSNAYDSERVLFYSRGFLVDSLMYDGVPALSNFNTGSIDETLDTAVYERIEVVRGATGLMTGAGSPAASINLVRKHADSRTATASLNLGFGSWRSKRAEADATLPLNADGSVRGRVVAAVEDGHSYQALYHKKKYVAYGVVDADLTPATRVSLGFDYQDNQPRSNTWGSFPLFLADGRQADWPRSVTTATDWAYWNRKTQTVFGELRQRFDNGWSVRASLNHRVYREDLELFYVFGYPDPTTGEGLDPYAYKSKGKITQNAVDLHASGPFKLFGREHELVLGYNGSRAKNVGTEYAAPDTLPSTGNFFAWNGSYPRPDFAQDGTPLSDIKTDQDGLYAVGRFSLADSLKLIAGARHARWNIDSFYVYDAPQRSSYSFNKVIPYAGLVWDVRPDVSVFASYTNIFKPQSSRDVDGHTLDPIDGRSVEVGIKGEHFGRQLNTSLTLFDTRQNNVAAPVLDPTTGDPVLLPDGTAASQGIDGMRTRGFEFEATGRLSSEWQGSLGWTRYLTKDANGQAMRTFIPNTIVRLFATWEPHAVEGLRLGAGVNWQSASSTTVGSPNGPTLLRQGSVTQLSLMARYRLSRHASVQFNANNATDRKFYVLDQYDNTYYGAPANYTLSLRLAY
jgi:outer-membrane receptor for ferric coprogen and ferric-rhodotorulic acid